MLSLAWRTQICHVLFSVFGLVVPAVNTKAALSVSDFETLKLYIAYWIVFSFFYLTEELFALLGMYQNTPPEVKLFLLLIYSNFQGSTAIYSNILKPIYDANEKDIDASIASLYNTSKSFFMYHSKNILWQIAFAPNDGILSMTGKFLGISMMNRASSLDDFNPASIDDNIENSISMDFYRVLKKGIDVSAGLTIEAMVPATCRLSKNTDYISIEADSAILSDERASIYSINDLSMFESRQIPLCLLDAFPTGQKIRSLSLMTLQVETDSHVSQLYVRAEEEKDEEALRYGLQVLCIQSREKYRTRITNLLSIISRFRHSRELLIAFKSIREYNR